jgi:micrococcal nuclease
MNATSILVVIALLATSSFSPASGMGAIRVALHEADEIEVKSVIRSDLDSDFVLIVQIEDQERYAVFLDFHEDSVASDVSQTFLLGWSPEVDGTYFVKTFVLSSFESPVLLDSFVRELRVNVNGNSTAQCNGSASCYTGIVTKIVDGDTLDVGDTRIRLALTNTPELDEAGYAAAKEFTSSLCPVGSYVLVDQDDIQLVDEYGRMLAQVTCQDGKILNAELLSNSHAEILSGYCSVSEFENESWALDYGCAQVPTVQAPTIIPDTGNNESANEEDCDPSYPAVCIPSPPPDLDCNEISHRNFKVLQPDPHGFDRDKDGIGCES